MNTKGILCCVSLAFGCLGQVGCALSSDSDTKDGTEQGALGVPDKKRQRTRPTTHRRARRPALGSSWAPNRAATFAAARTAGVCPVAPESRGRAKRAPRSRALAIRMAAMAAPRRNSSANPIDGKAVDSFHPRRARRGRDGVLPTGFASPADLAVRSRCTRARATLSSPPHVGRTKSLVGQDRPPRRVRTSSDLGTHARRDGIEHRHDGGL